MLLDRPAFWGYIVRAVNCHEELIAALKDLRYYVQTEIRGTALAGRVDEAIAKAEGK